MSAGRRALGLAVIAASASVLSCGSAPSECTTELSCSGAVATSGSTAASTAASGGTGGTGGATSAGGTGGATPPGGCTQTVVSGTDDLGDATVTITLPGYVAVRVSDGSKVPAGPCFTGLDGFWDLKNDPGQIHDLAGCDAGLLSKDFGYAGTFEAKPSGGTIAIVEQSCVRTVVEFSWPVRPYGNNSYPIEPSLTGKERWTIYRPGKIYERFAFSNTTSSPITLDYFQYNFHTSWTKFDGESGCYSDAYWQTNGSYVPKVPSPWGFVFEQADGSTSPSHWMLHSTAVGTTMVPPDPTPGIVQALGGMAIPVKASFLEIELEDAGSYAYYGQPFVGLRSKLETQGTVPPGSETFVRHLVLWAGDNGITDRATAGARAAEYEAAPALSMTAGTTAGFDYDSGSFELAAASDHVDFTIAAPLSFPAFDVTAWASAAPSTIRVDGSPLDADTDFVAEVSGSRLILQILRALPAGARIQIP